MCAPEDLSLDAASLQVYGYDNSRRSVPAQAVVFARSATQVAALVNLCRQFRVPLVARGRGTNTTGATVPVQGGVVLAFERMNRIIEVNPDDRLAVVEPGVLNGTLQTALRPFGLMWAPDPTSAPFASIGGNLACNAGGPRAVKYGSCRDNVLAVQAVDGRGRVLRLGTRTTKGSTGYDLMRVLIGSEGTLALITEATLKLVPLPAGRALLRAVYDDVESAAKAVARLMCAPLVPAALEFMDAQAIRLARDVGGAELEDAGALLMIEVDGEGEALAGAVATLGALARGPGLKSLDEARSPEQIEALWRARRALSPALRTLAPKKINEDVVVPVSRLPELVRQAEAWALESGFPIVCFGHAGNGNLHVNLLIDPDQPEQAARAAVVLDALFRKVIALGGTLSGEHGIGLDKRDFLPLAFDADTLAVMYEMKDWLDPSGILNPAKVLPLRS
ncbi:MAG: FAD-binding protein [Ahniella sp.]|nr:FAD-binding protein [Ahniella sp.]